MAWLPSDLHIRCRTTLIKCSEFDNHASLQAVFVTEELAIYRDRIPQAASKDERVGQTTFFLLEQRLSGGRPVFPVFLATLRNKYASGDAMRDELEELCAEVEQTINHARITVPFVIAAMTSAQATDLFTEAVFNDPAVAPIERERFHQFMTALQAHGIAHRKDFSDGTSTLIYHRDTPIIRHIKVRGDKSPYDGDWVYWGQRLERSLTKARRVIQLLRQQKGRCAHCGLYFEAENVIEIHHQDDNRRNNRYSNLVLLHVHCHDQTHSESANDNGLRI
ncbi:MAG: HNH endonuclease [Anaerolineae bacterium]|nr:HNH endonuclease [Anaerolineae bacterium]